MEKLCLVLSKINNSIDHEEFTDRINKFNDNVIDLREQITTATKEKLSTKTSLSKNDSKDDKSLSHEDTDKNSTIPHKVTQNDTIKAVIV